MACDPNHEVLFEPVRIGPVTAPNRFYQVPHCSGMPHLVPRGYDAMREIKAEGGWGVVCTEACSIHPTSDAQPTPEDKLWDDGDIPYLARMVERVKRHGALAGVEILHHGAAVANRQSREYPIACSPGKLVRHKDPIQPRVLGRNDIREFRRWHRDAALRARRAGFDIVYVYAGHEVSLPMQFLWRRYNTRTDEYGGNLENRARLLRELIEDTRDAVGDTCAVAVRFAVDELLGASGITHDGEGREVVEMLAELPDLWDVTVAFWANDSTTARFAEEGWQEPYVRFVKQVTTRPVVGTGRFTSPDTMAAMVRRGVLDFIGAARPSIADPFLPAKIARGESEDIRECIGCNICVTGNNTQVPIRCTQNPTVGEEHRRGWHPERIPAKRSDEAVLVVGGGPAGLECARALGQRGYPVLLAESGTELGGRLRWESTLPGLSTWLRVRDYRLAQLRKLPNVDVYFDSRLSADDIRGFDIPHVAIATGAAWRRDGVGQATFSPVPGWDTGRVLIPEEVAAGTEIVEPVVVYDDDHFYLGGVLAERIRARGRAVTLITPAAEASIWTHATLEQEKIQRRLLESGVNIVPHRRLTSIEPGIVETACVFTGRRERCPAETVVMVTCRLPEDALYHELAANRADIVTLGRIGDCLAPSTIAQSVWAGHRFAREFQEDPPKGAGYLRERVDLHDACRTEPILENRTC